MVLPVAVMTELLLQSMNSRRIEGTPRAGAALRPSFRFDGRCRIAALGQLAPDHVVTDADFFLNVGEGPAFGTQPHHRFQFIRRKGHAPRGPSIRQLPPVLRPARIGGDVGFLRGRKFPPLVFRHRTTNARVLRKSSQAISFLPLRGSN